MTKTAVSQSIRSAAKSRARLKERLTVLEERVLYLEKLIFESKFS